MSNAPYPDYMRDTRSHAEAHAGFKKAVENARCRARLEAHTNPHVSLPITDKSIVKTDRVYFRCELHALPAHDEHQTTIDGKETRFRV